MLGDTTTGPGQPANPDPHQDRSGEAMPQPGRFGRLLGLVRKLVDYGKELVSTLQQTEPADDHLPIKLHFGTAEIALILRRITNGLLRAATLEYRLIDCVDREAMPQARTAPSPRVPSPRVPSRTAPARMPRTRAPRAKPDPQLADRLPTAEEIAAQVRRRPIGAVLADICEDLGILPSHPLWRELHMAITSNGGGYLALVHRVTQRYSAAVRDNLDVLMRQPLPPSWPPHPDTFGVEAATGPP